MKLLIHSQTSTISKFITHLTGHLSMLGLEWNRVNIWSLMCHRDSTAVVILVCYTEITQARDSHTDNRALAKAVYWFTTFPNDSTIISFDLCVYLMAFQCMHRLCCHWFVSKMMSAKWQAACLAHSVLKGNAIYSGVRFIRSQSVPILIALMSGRFYHFLLYKTSGTVSCNEQVPSSKQLWNTW